ncbi:Uncharacterized conserved protein [Chlamydia trachomatis]|nr:Uncharacterized conserved protein [Chlamydia trachomatis]
MSKFWIIVLMIIYVVSPLDIIPDVVPVAGQADDLAVIIAALIAASKK